MAQRAVTNPAVAALHRRSMDRPTDRGRPTPETDDRLQYPVPRRGACALERRCTTTNISDDCLFVLK